MSEKWKIKESGAWYHVEDGEGGLVYISAGKSEPERKTAHLIAAAPEMLELLKVCRKGIIAIMEDDRFGDYWGLRGELDRVIALAEGDEK